MIKNLKLFVISLLTILITGLVLSGVPAVAETSAVTKVNGTMPLLIFNVQVSNITELSASLTWQTNGSATSQVFYDTQSHVSATDYASHSNLDNTLVTQHSLVLSGLLPSTTYHCRANSLSGTDFVAVSDDLTFTTMPAVQIEPNVITAGGIPLGSNAAVLWGSLTDLGSASSAKVYFQWGTTTAYGFMSESHVLKHPQYFLTVITDLNAPATYHFRAVAEGNRTSYGQDTTFSLTTTTLVTSATPSVYGQLITLTAKVSPSTATGNVTFYDDGDQLGNATLISGQATFLTSSLKVSGSPHHLYAAYRGNDGFSTSFSNTVNQQVYQAATKTTLIAAPNPSIYGQTLIFSATVSAVSPGGGTPEGTVTFKEGSKTLGTAKLSGGSATLRYTGAWAVGTHNITAVYAGNTYYESSSSNTVTQVVNKAATSTNLTSSSNPAQSGSRVTLTASVATVAPGGGTPPNSDTMTFKEGAKTLGTVKLNDGRAQLTISNLPKGTHSITAVYYGGNSFAGSTSNIVSQTIK
jgi:hypothetical protein